MPIALLFLEFYQRPSLNPRNTYTIFILLPVFFLHSSRYKKCICHSFSWHKAKLHIIYLHLLSFSPTLFQKSLLLSLKFICSSGRIEASKTSTNNRKCNVFIKEKLNTTFRLLHRSVLQ